MKFKSCFFFFHIKLTAFIPITPSISSLTTLDLGCWLYIPYDFHQSILRHPTYMLVTIRTSLYHLIPNLPILRSLHISWLLIWSLHTLTIFLRIWISVASNIILVLTAWGLVSAAYVTRTQGWEVAYFTYDKSRDN